MNIRTDIRCVFLFFNNYIYILYITLLFYIRKNLRNGPVFFFIISHWFVSSEACGLLLHCFAWYNSSAGHAEVGTADQCAEFLREFTWQRTRRYDYWSFLRNFWQNGPVFVWLILVGEKVESLIIRSIAYAMVVWNRVFCMSFKSCFRLAKKTFPNSPKSNWSWSHGAKKQNSCIPGGMHQTKSNPSMMIPFYGWELLSLQEKNVTSKGLKDVVYRKSWQKWFGEAEGTLPKL